MWVGDDWHGSNWRVPAQEHFQVLKDGGFPGEVRVGLVGGVSERVEAMQEIIGMYPGVRFSAKGEDGFEMVTIHALHEWAKEANPDTPVYYSHSKGAFNDTAANHRWRQQMDDALGACWDLCVDSLKKYDAVGLHWLTSEDYPQHIDPKRPMFGGNFWWAKAGYLAGLPPVGYRTRWEAEGWMGQGFPKVLDLKPGWPDYTSET